MSYLQVFYYKMVKYSVLEFLPLTREEDLTQAPWPSGQALEPTIASYVMVFFPGLGKLSAYSRFYGFTFSSQQSLILCLLKRNHRTR